MNVTVSDIVVSKAGHDIKQAFAVIKTEGEFAYIVDGKRRKADNPKKKNIKHLQVIGRCSGKFKPELLGIAPLNKIIKEEINNCLLTNKEG